MARLLLVIAAFVVAAAVTHAQILGARPAGTQNASRPVASPAGAWTPLPVEFSRRVVRSDGVEVGKQVMTFGPGTALEMPWNLLGLWQQVESPGFSTGWVQRANRQIRLTVSAMRPALARTLLDPERWNAFVGSLRAREVENVRVLCDDDTQANQQMLRLMGWRTRVFQCTFVPPAVANKAALPPQGQLIAACSDGNAAYVFTLDGPADIVASYQREFERILVSFEPVAL